MAELAAGEIWRGIYDADSLDTFTDLRQAWDTIDDRGDKALRFANGNILGLSEQPAGVSGVFDNLDSIETVLRLGRFVEPDTAAVPTDPEWASEGYIKRLQALGRYLNRAKGLWMVVAQARPDADAGGVDRIQYDGPKVAQIKGLALFGTPGSGGPIQPVVVGKNMKRRRVTEPGPIYISLGR